MAGHMPSGDFFSTHNACLLPVRLSQWNPVGGHRGLDRYLLDAIRALRSFLLRLYPEQTRASQVQYQRDSNKFPD